MNIKKIIFLSLLALRLPGVFSTQSTDNGLCYVSSEKEEEKVEKRKTPTADAIMIETNASITVYASPDDTTIVVKDRGGNTRDVGEYNRRYNLRNYGFPQEGGTLYIGKKKYGGLNGEWVNGFDDSKDDYEYTTRIVRFRNPHYAISIGSLLYRNVVYGLSSWGWNVYTNGLYACTFPTLTNRLWWGWRYNSYGWDGYPYYGWGRSSWYGPGWGFGWSIGWDGWYGDWWGHYHRYHPEYYSDRGHWGRGYWPRNMYTYRRSSGVSSHRNFPSIVCRSGSSVTRRDAGSTIRSSGTSSYRRSG